jgi:hypothetical protein
MSPLWNVILASGIGGYVGAMSAMATVGLLALFTQSRSLP